MSGRVLTHSSKLSGRNAKIHVVGHGTLLGLEAVVGDVPPVDVTGPSCIIHQTGAAEPLEPALDCYSAAVQDRHALPLLDAVEQLANWCRLFCTRIVAFW